MPNAKRQTPNAKRQTPNAKRQTPNESVGTARCNFSRYEAQRPERQMHSRIGAYYANTRSSGPGSKCITGRIRGNEETRILQNQPPGQPTTCNKKPAKQAGFLYSRQSCYQFIRNRTPPGIPCSWLLIRSDWIFMYSWRVTSFPFLGSFSSFWSTVGLISVAVNTVPPLSISS